MSETARTSANRRLVEALQRNWQAEMEGAATYRTLAERERDPHRRSVLLKLAEAEVRHAQRWERRLHELGAPIPTYTGSPTGEADSLANRIGGPESALRRVERGEREHIAAYSRQLQELNDEPSAQILHEVIADERGHSQTLRSLMVPTSTRDARTHINAASAATYKLAETKRTVKPIRPIKSPNRSGAKAWAARAGAPSSPVRAPYP